MFRMKQNSLRLLLLQEWQLTKKKSICIKQNKSVPPSYETQFYLQDSPVNGVQESKPMRAELQCVGNMQSS
jgi:hypothetical protein